ncbi:DUF983 domain-containing protein [Terrarubrum flagellatum]|uniref:DUF983 domain-containing protein n=1 Tax=Terrirubrum flagellatum TaxID=2895980 RepID=UPI00314532C9
MPITTSFESVAAEPARDTRRAMWRGFTGRCPKCGEGRLFGRFLKVVPACARCGEDMHHHRADDFPAYLTIVIVGHIAVGGLVFAETEANWPLWLHVALWPTLALILSIGLLQPIKGAVVGLQWALRMHGFGRKNVLDEGR